MASTTTTPAAPSYLSVFKKQDTGLSFMDLVNGQQNAVSVSSLIIERLRNLEKSDNEAERSQYVQAVQAMIINLAIDFPSVQCEFVELLDIINKQPETEPVAAILMNFGMATGDEHSYLATQTDPLSVARYGNINAFEARLWSRLGPDFGSNLLGNPITKLAGSIEKSWPDDDSIQSADSEISVGCMWMIHAGPLIWSLSQAEEKGNKDCGMLWSADQPGYGVARWHFWLQRFDAISQGEIKEVSQATRRHAAAAVRTMRLSQEAGSSN